MAAVEWILTMKQGIKIMDQDCVLPVKYEQFVSDPAFRSQILNFCNLSEDQNFNGYCKEVLKMPSKKEPVILPDEIADEFNRIMKLLGCE